MIALIINVFTVASMILALLTYIVAKRDKIEYQKKVKEYDNLLESQKDEFILKLQEFNKLGKLEKETPELIDNLYHILSIVSKLKEKINLFQPTTEDIQEVNHLISNIETDLYPKLSQSIFRKTENLKIIQKELSNIENSFLNRGSWIRRKGEMALEISDFENIVKEEIANRSSGLEEFRNKMYNIE